MKRTSFSFDLPESLIASAPTKVRTGSRLLSLDGPRGELNDRLFTDLEALLEPGDLLVFNDTKVIPARVYATKETGGKIEILVERMLTDDVVLAHVRSSKSPKEGSRVVFDTAEPTTAEMLGREGALFKLQFSRPTLDVLDEIGHMPLPPYIERDDTEEDRDRYQTVYSEKLGAVAAPTAGLHFDEAMLERLKSKGVNQAFVTLHVGAGTFQPVRVDDIESHHMHSEWIDVPQSVVDTIHETKKRGGRVVAVGTTSVRSLESAAASGELKAMTGDTSIFIYPGYQYQVVDALITNFHLPESTLLMLVSAFAGYEHTMNAYRHAVANEYRFFSYGDAMFITRNPDAINEEVN